MFFPLTKFLKNVVNNPIIQRFSANWNCFVILSSPPPQKNTYLLKTFFPLNKILRLTLIPHERKKKTQPNRKHSPKQRTLLTFAPPNSYWRIKVIEAEQSPHFHSSRSLRVSTSVFLSFQAYCSFHNKETLLSRSY